MTHRADEADGGNCPCDVADHGQPRIQTVRFVVAHGDSGLRRVADAARRAEAVECPAQSTHHEHRPSLRGKRFELACVIFGILRQNFDALAQMDQILIEEPPLTLHQHCLEAQNQHGPYEVDDLRFLLVILDHQIERALRHVVLVCFEHGLFGRHDFLRLRANQRDVHRMHRDDGEQQGKQHPHKIAGKIAFGG